MVQVLWGWAEATSLAACLMARQAYATQVISCTQAPTLRLVAPRKMAGPDWRHQGLLWYMAMPSVWVMGLGASVWLGTCSGQQIRCC